MQKLNRDRVIGKKKIINTTSIFLNWIRMHKPG